MAKVIGYHDSHFKFDDGRTADGMTLYFVSPIPNGVGQMAEKQFVSFDKLKDSGYTPQINDEIFIDRNARGGVKGVLLLRPAK